MCQERTLTDSTKEDSDKEIVQALLETVQKLERSQESSLVAENSVESLELAKTLKPRWEVIQIMLEEGTKLEAFQKTAIENGNLPVEVVKLMRETRRRTSSLLGGIRSDLDFYRTILENLITHRNSEEALKNLEKNKLRCGWHMRMLQVYVKQSGQLTKEFPKIVEPSVGKFTEEEGIEILKQTPMDAETEKNVVEVEKSQMKSQIEKMTADMEKLKLENEQLRRDAEKICKLEDERRERTASLEMELEHEKNCHLTTRQVNTDLQFQNAYLLKKVQGYKSKINKAATTQNWLTCPSNLFFASSPPNRFAQ